MVVLAADITGQPPRRYQCAACGIPLRVMGWRVPPANAVWCGRCVAPLLDARDAEPLPLEQIPGQLELPDA
jgi:hypothetical protein